MGYSVTYDGSEVASGGQFGSSESSTFGSCNVSPTPAPVSPTPAPVSPTPAPVSPTLAPVAPVAPIGSPVASPIASPVDDWELIFAENFEDATDDDNFNTNNRLVEGVSVAPGTWSARIKRTQKLMGKQVVISDYSELSVDFMFRGSGMEAGDSFFLEARFNGDQGWSPLGEWVSGTDFTNGEWAEGNANVSTSGKRKIKLRFRANGDKGNDRIYIDDVIFKGQV